MANTSNTVVIPARANQPDSLFKPFFAKHPNDTVQYCVDASGFCQYSGRTIVSVSVTINSITGKLPVTISGASFGGGRSVFLVSGGSDNTDYMLTWSAQLDNGTSLTRNITVPIRGLFFAQQGADVIAKGDPGSPGELANAPAVFAAFTTLTAEERSAFAAGIAADPAFASAFIGALPTSPAGLSVGQVWNDGGIPVQVTAL